MNLSESFFPGDKASSPSDTSILPELQKSIQSLQEAAEQREKQLAELTASLQEAQRKQASLQLEKDDAQEENAVLLQNYTRLQTSVAELQTRVQEQEGKALQKAQLDQKIHMLKHNLTGRVWFILCHTMADFSFLHIYSNSFFVAAEKEIERLKSLAEVSMSINTWRYIVV